MTERPLLFLDVDGVLNCPGERQDDHVPHFVGHETIWVPTHTRERVARLLAVYDPIWATAWVGRAHSAWRHVLDLPGESWPYLNYLDFKLPEIIRIAKFHRWAWVDDDANWELRKLGWDRSMVNGLVLDTDHREGLTDAHVGQLLAYAKGDS